MRGSVKSPGAEYMKERIAERISERVQNREKTRTGGYTRKRLIDTSQEKFQESAGLKQWAEIENLKTTALTVPTAIKFLLSIFLEMVYYK